MNDTVLSVFELLIPLVGVILIVTALAVTGLVRERRREREALYRYETARKLVDQGQLDFAQFQAFVEGEEQRVADRRREGLKLTGWLLLFCGGMLTGGIAVMANRTPDWMQFLVISTIPEVLGFGLLLYVYVLGPRAPKRPAK